MLRFSDQWRWIYDEQMPLYAWIAKTLLDASGQSVLALDLLKYSFVGAAMWALSATAERQTVGAGVVAVSAAFLLPTVNDDLLSEVTHTAALIAATGLSLWLVARALDGRQRRLWLWLGLAWGAGLAFKHTMIIVATAQAMAVLAVSPAPRRPLAKQLLGAGLVMGLVASPFLAILAIHSEAVHAGVQEFYQVDRSTGAILRDILGSPLAEGGLLIIAATVAWTRCQRPLSHMETVSIIAVAVFLALMSAGALISGVDVIRDRWLAPGLVMLAPAAATMLRRPPDWTFAAFSIVAAIALWRAIETATAGP